MAIHQKLVLTQRLEDIEMTDLRPANVIIIITNTIIIISTTTIIIITNILRAEPVAVGGKLLVTAAVEAAGATQIFRSLSSSSSPS